MSFSCYFVVFFGTQGLRARWVNHIDVSCKILLLCVGILIGAFILPKNNQLKQNRENMVD